MAYKSTGSAGKSPSGASMSRYDVEVESRLQKLESQAHSKCDGNGGGSVDLEEKIRSVEAKIDDLEKRLARKYSF